MGPFVAHKSGRKAGGSVIFQGLSTSGVVVVQRFWPAAAQAEGVARAGPVLSEEQLSRLAVVGQAGPRQATTPGQDLLEPWADQIYRWITNDRL